MGGSFVALVRRMLGNLGKFEYHTTEVGVPCPPTGIVYYIPPAY